MTIYNLLVSICWIIFVVVWITSARGVKKSTSVNSWFRQGWIFRLAIIVIIIVVVSQPGAKNWLKVHSNPTTNPIIGTLAVVLCVAGVALAIWARRSLGKNWGMPMTIKQEPELVTSGPYRYIRHPIYTGVILAMAGSALISGVTWAILLACAAIYFLYSAITEERNMEKLFPAQYPAYKQRTKMLIPLIF